MGRRLRHWGANAALLLLGTAAALVLLEILLRFFDPLGQRLWGDAIVLPTNYRQVITNTKNRRLPPRIVFSKNGLGFRGPDPPKDFGSALSVVAVGGSTTESRYQSDGETWPELVGRRLAPHFRGLWLDNAGLDGHSSYGHLLLLKQRLVRLRPKVVLFLIGINDVGRDDLKRVDAELIGAGEEAGLLTRLARVSAIAAGVQNFGRSREAQRARLFTYGELNLRRLPQIVYRGRHPERVLRRHREGYLEPFRARVFELVRVCREAGMLPVLITQPALYGDAIDELSGVDLRTVEVDHEEKINGELAWRILELYNDVTREAGRAAGVPVIEAAQRLAKSSRLFYDFVHFTDAGARALADIVAPELCRVLEQAFPQAALGRCSDEEP